MPRPNKVDAVFLLVVRGTLLLFVIIWIAFLVYTIIHQNKILNRYEQLNAEYEQLLEEYRNEAPVDSVQSLP